MQPTPLGRLERAGTGAGIGVVMATDYPPGVWVDDAGAGHDPTPTNLATMEAAIHEMAAAMGADVAIIEPDAGGR
jgi:hypothetical protein